MKHISESAKQVAISAALNSEYPLLHLIHLYGCGLLDDQEFVASVFEMRGSK